MLGIGIIYIIKKTIMNEEMTTSQLEEQFKSMWTDWFKDTFLNWKGASADTKSESNDEANDEWLSAKSNQENKQDDWNKDKQLVKILRSQLKAKNEEIQKISSEIKELRTKNDNWEIEDNDFQEQLLEKMLEKKLAEKGLNSSIEKERTETISKYNLDENSLITLEDIRKEHPTLTYEQAVILFKSISNDDKTDIRQQAKKQSINWYSTIPIDKDPKTMSSKDIESELKEQFKRWRFNL